MRATSLLPPASITRGEIADWLHGERQVLQQQASMQQQQQQPMRPPSISLSRPRCMSS